MKQLHVLLVTRECLSYGTNEGNVLLHLFEGLPVTLANIYCKPGVPDNKICESYFQLTDRMAAANILRHKPMGCSIELQGEETVAFGQKMIFEKENKGFYDFFRCNNWEIFRLARECLWQLADFKSPALDKFLRDFAPDVIIAPLCYSRFVLRVQRYVIQQTHCPAVTYVWDDLYSLRQFSLSPIYWVNRILLRAAIRKTLLCYKKAYTMSQPQAEAFSKELGIPIKVLPKCIDVSKREEKTHKGIRMIYAGGLYYGRDTILAKVADAVCALRAEGYDVSMDIYANSPLQARRTKLLQDEPACQVHPTVTADQMRKEYTCSDIALHVESFRKKFALFTRLSFSTKIVDCLASGCAVLAVCPPENTGWQYLKNEGAALCVDSPAGVESAVRKLVTDAVYRQKLADSARDCMIRNHQKETVQIDFLAELRELAAGKGEDA